MKIYSVNNANLYLYKLQISKKSQKHKITKKAFIDQLMFKFRTNCPTHNLPFIFVSFAQNNPLHLRCQNCPYDASTCLRMQVQLEYMRNRMGEQKTKQRQKCRQRSKSRGKKYMPSQEEEQEAVIGQKIAEQQVVILELVMKLLAEDKKKYYEHLEKAIADHKKLWKQYTQSTNDIMFLNRVCQSDVLAPLIGSMSLKGWESFKEVFKNIYNRVYISQKIIKQSAEITQQLKKQAKISEQTVLRSIEILLSNYKSSKQVENDRKPIQNNRNPEKQKQKQKSGDKDQRNDKKPKRSKSFAK